MAKKKKNNLKDLFRKIKLLILDVDGVLTKGEIIYDDKGRELKMFNVKDGLGILLLRIAGIKAILLSAKNSPMLKRRAKDMRVAEVIGGILPKESMLGKIKDKYRVREEEICFIGDDLIDLGLIEKVGLGVAVADAPLAVKKGAGYITSRKGGEGAVREVVDLIIKAQKLEKKVYRFLKNPKLFLSIFVFLFISLNVQAYSQQRIKDFYLANFKDDGTRSWEVRGREALIHDKYIDIDKMNANYYIEDDTINITSDYAKLNKENMDVNLKENVHIENKDGATMDTESLNWYKEKNHIETNDRVTMNKDSMQITAKGLSADTQFKTANFKEDVEVILPDEDSKSVSTITCTGPLEIEYSKGKAVFNENVVAIHPSGKMFSDKATLFFDTEKKQLIKVISEGNVKIVKDDNVAFAQKATYFGKEERIVLEGRPRLIYFTEGQGNDDLF